MFVQLYSHSWPFLLVKSPLIAGSIPICCWLISRGSHFLVAISFVNVQVTPFIPFILAGYISHYFYNVISPRNPSFCCLYQFFPSICPVPTLPGHIFFHLPALGPGEVDEGWHERHSMQHVPWRPWGPVANCSWVCHGGGGLGHGRSRAWSWPIWRRPTSWLPSSRARWRLCRM